MTIGVVARLVIALTHTGIVYPDETYQMTEAAHRVVFGYGLVPWEFQQGLRSWIGPGTLLPPMLLGRWLGVAGAELMLLVKGWVALWAGAGLVLTTIGARRLGGNAAGLLAAGLAAISPLALVYDVHPLADTVAAPLPALALVLLTRRDRGRHVDGAAVSAGIALVAAGALRPQLLPVVLGLTLATLLSRSRARLTGLAIGLAAGALLSGVLDTLTWGLPFAPEWRSTMFNVVDDGSRLWGQQPATFYLTTSWHVLGPLGVVVLGAGVLLAAVPRRSEDPVLPIWPVAAGVLLFLAFLSALGHKELRFVVPAVPLIEILSAVGLARAAQAAARWAGARRAGARRAGAQAGPAVRPSAALVATAITAVGLFAAGSHARHLTMRDLGYVGDRRSAWRADDLTPRMLAVAGSLPETCGVVMLVQRVTWSGGYSYLHKDVPLDSVKSKQAGDWPAWANVVVTSSRSQLPAGYRPVAHAGTEVLALRPGPCAPPPPAVAARVIPRPNQPVASALGPTGPNRDRR
ncbi:MAG TPA: hypothetical protein VMT69_14765 [Kineosporiaceae bacterium]|nr:hypothetical protein [Kineosporiaceae bacterium]